MKVRLTSSGSADLPNLLLRKEELGSGEWWK
jgi:hypothetical protein